MLHRLDVHLRERTNGYTVDPAQYAIVAYVALGALTLIVLSGAAVRLTGSGLGCPDWPKCYGKAYPPLNAHAVIEFSNRVITGPVSIAAGAAWLLALRRRPYRRDLMWLGALLPAGVVAQAVLGGFTVRGALDYGWVMGHFALSMLIILAAVLLAWRASHEPQAEEDRTADASRGPERSRWLVWWLRGLVALGALTIFAGTAATAAGPHAGGSPGQKINRLNFEGRRTMDFVIHRHGEIALAFGLLAVAIWWFARRRHAAPSVQRPLTVLCVLLALQGAVGLDQYKTHLPAELVWVHVALASCSWLAALWAACAAGAFAPRRARAGAERTPEGALSGVAPLEFPGN
ncbi:MAG TPA: COX15/CtaA family protein [Solirubrobacteraceae bacterium]|jgi:cytochrome c oxidase assembly protein subunit 15|nr:COX15/CtaA family protein [Solirubrobacteraceae bacterium]